MSSLTSLFLMSLLMSSFLKIKYYKLRVLVSLKINSTIFKKIVPHTMDQFMDRFEGFVANIVRRELKFV